MPGTSGTMTYVNNYYRKVLLVNGNGPQTHTFNLGISGPSGERIGLNYLAWNTPQTGSVTGSISIYIGASVGVTGPAGWTAGITAQWWSCSNIGELNFKNTVGPLYNPGKTGSDGILYVESGFPIGTYSILMEVGLPYNQLGTVH